MTARDTPGIHVPPPLLFALPFTAGIALHHAVGHDAIPPALDRYLRPAGIALLALGGGLATTALVSFLRAGTSPLPFHPATSVVTTGPYRFSRNPMYVGMALVYLGLPPLLGYAWPYLLFPLAALLVGRLVIAREERYLEGKFGEAYRRYRAATRRWI